MTHLADRLFRGARPPGAPGWILAGSLAFRFGIPHQAPFGHRGAFHSLALAGMESGPDGRYIAMPVMWMRSQRHSVLSRKLRPFWHKRLTPGRAVDIVES